MYRSMLLFLSCVLATLCQVVNADDFVIGVEDIEYYPIYAKREGQYAGFSRELLDEFAKKSGHSFTYKPLPIKRLYGDFLNQKLDFKFPDSSYWKSDLKQGKDVVYSDSVLEYIDGVLVRPERIGAGKNQLKNLGVLRGFTAWDYLADAEAKTIRIKEGNSLDGLIKMVDSKRIDGVYFNVIVARYFLQNTQFNNNPLVFDDSLPHTRSHYYLSTIKHAGVIASFNDFLKNNRNLIETLKAKYKVKIL